MRRFTASKVDKLAEGLKRPCLLPLVRTFDGCPDPAKLYFSLRRTFRPSYLLESADGPGEIARYSVMGCDPHLYIKAKGNDCQVIGRQDLVEITEKISRKDDPLEFLKEILGLIETKMPEDFSSYVVGLVGYIAYDYVRSLVDVGNHTVDDLDHPDFEFIFPERMIILDHARKKTHQCSLMLLTEETCVGEAYDYSLSKLKELESAREVQPQNEGNGKISLGSNTSKVEFEAQVGRIKQYIRRGDIIQSVLSRRIELKPAPPLEHFYFNLRHINPSPYMFFLDFPERSIVGSSPEILVKVGGQNVHTRPIAGTRRRGRNEIDDEIMERELRVDEKEQAEHIMLVDLGRNDIGRVSRFGSVEISNFMKVEKYSHVQHLVTDVRGKMSDEKDAFDALRATFPAGTVTGAPKVRAMEIIDELEPTRRGIYAGAIGSFSPQGNADLAITIRTLIVEKGSGFIQVGAGIVSDSVPRLEHLETENKARALLSAAGV